MATSARSRSTSARAIHRRSFAPEVLKRAREVAERYQVVMWREEDGYYGRGLELPGAMGDGSTPDRCMKSTRDSMAALVAYMLEKGESPPPPASDGQRTEQVNVRLTAEERARLETLARQSGFQGISDYVRVTALAGRAGKSAKQ